MNKSFFTFIISFCSGFWYLPLHFSRINSLKFYWKTCFLEDIKIYYLKFFSGFLWRRRIHYQARCPWWYFLCSEERNSKLDLSTTFYKVQNSLFHWICLKIIPKQILITGQKDNFISVFYNKKTCELQLFV